MLKQSLMTASLIASLSLATIVQADTSRWVGVGTPLSELSIDATKTKEMGGGTVDDPLLYLKSDRSGFWTSPFVIASPSHGVCSYGEFADAQMVSSANLDDVIAEFLEVELPILEDQLGKFAILSEDQSISEWNAEAILYALANEGSAQLLSNGNPRAGRLISEVLFELDENSLKLSHTTFYSNIQDCHSEIYDAS